MSLRESVRDLASEASLQNNCRLYDIFSHRDRFQIFIDRPKGFVSKGEDKEALPEKDRAFLSQQRKKPKPSLLKDEKTTNSHSKENILDSGFSTQRKAFPSISLDDCEKVSYSLSFLLRSKIPDFFKKWHLEVSSPGLERKLKQKWHFKEALGEEVKITAFLPTRAFDTQTKREWETRAFSGRLAELKEDSVKLIKGFIEWEVPFTEIKQARVVFLLPAKAHQVKQSRRRRKAKKRRNR